MSLENEILNISYIREIPFYDFQFQICYTISENNNVEFICYRILSPIGNSYSFGLDINNSFINNTLRENYSNLNQNNEFIYDHYLKSLINRSISEYYSILNSRLDNSNNNFLFNSTEIYSNNNQDFSMNEIQNNRLLENSNYIVSNNPEILDETYNNLFYEFSQNAENFLENLYFLHSIPINFQNHLKSLIYGTIWSVYDTIINIPDNFWNNNFVKFTELDFNKFLKHENMNNNTLINLNKDDNTCSICLDSINNDQKITILHCNHIYHYDCAKQWFINKDIPPKCPYCRSDII